MMANKWVLNDMNESERNPGKYENMKIWRRKEEKKKKLVYPKKRITVAQSEKEFQKRFGMISSLLMKGNTAE